MPNIFSKWNYIPILAISPAEMAALEQLPDKDKDKLLPLFSLKGWATANKLENTLNRITKSISSRAWIADLDISFLTDNKVYLFTGDYPDRPVFKELKELTNPYNGFENWCAFIERNENLIPCIRHESLENIENQIHRLSSLNRGLVFRINPTDSNQEKHSRIINALNATKAKDVLIIYDLETIDRNYEEIINPLLSFMLEAKTSIQDLTLSVSATSFPNGFAKQNHGHNSIYERVLFNKIIKKEELHPIIYSDRGSARALKQDGGSGTPPPRIDYPLKKDWQFVRQEFDEHVPDSKEKRKQAYVEIANEVINAPYWIPELRLWGTQQIELTAESNNFGIDSAMKSTAARINIHLFNQLHYNTEDSEINTDEEWID